MAQHDRFLASTALILLLGLGVAGCGGVRPGQIPEGVSEPDTYLFEQGTEALEDGKWLAAREYFRQLFDAYPQSPHRPDAKLGLGDAYLGEGSPEGYVNAQQEFGEFLAYYPTHVRADYAQYRLAMTHFRQMAKAQRDQTQTKLAIVGFQTFFQNYPNSDLTPDVRKYHREARDRLSESIYRIGLHYFRTRWYPGAIARFREVLENDGQYTYRDAVYYYLAESLARIDRGAEALPYLTKLEDEFIESEYLERSQQLSARLKSSLEVEIKSTTRGPS